ncbi:MAG: N-acetyltransferase [Brevundimonas sp.]|uniref:GNAT family N-acetyltransferase n=1 Tax=Brevundimonas sp. TaxID=1871086 RepID=UPI0011F58890|nr:GNAT family N-acetyltransferase [Brevundimonas sp.]RZJ16374.1 MAG: N-acetyltransferase [Brevundimonas sp.]
MSDFIDHADDRRFEQTFADADGAPRPVWADYAVRGDERVILHVEADPALRGTGAAGRFMQALADHARAQGLKLNPHCSYAVAWLKRHREYEDIVA